MCIIFASEKGNLPKRSKLSVAYDNNPHGVGFMWQDGSVVRTMKGNMTFGEAWNFLTLLEGKSYACHFRWRTRGKIRKTSCHPFRITTADGPAWLMHNGTIFSMPSVGKMSDTQVFAKKLSDSLYGSNYSREIVHTNDFLENVSAHVEGFNKLVFMTPKGLSFVNKDANGTFTENGIWYSNDYSFNPGHRNKGKKNKSHSPLHFTTNKNNRPNKNTGDTLDKAIENAIEKRKAVMPVRERVGGSRALTRARLAYHQNPSDDI